MPGLFLLNFFVRSSALEAKYQVFVERCNRAAIIWVHDWLNKKLASLFHPIRSKNKTNRDSSARVFPRLTSATRNYFEFWLVHCITSVLCDWLESLLWFWFYDTWLTTAPRTEGIHTSFWLSPWVSLSAVKWRSTRMMWKVPGLTFIGRNRKFIRVTWVRNWLISFTDVTTVQMLLSRKSVTEKENHTRLLSGNFCFRLLKFQWIPSLSPFYHIVCIFLSVHNIQ